MVIDLSDKRKWRERRMYKDMEEKRRAWEAQELTAAERRLLVIAMPVVLCVVAGIGVFVVAVIKEVFHG